MCTCPLLRSVAIALLGAILFASPALADEEPFTSATAAPVVISGPDSPDNDLAPSWAFSAADVASFECSLARDETLVGDWAPCSSPVAYDLSAQPDGAYAFAVRAIGVDGSVSDTATSPYTLDTSVPALPTIVALPGPAASDRSPRWSFSGGAGEQLECRLDRGKESIAGWAPCASPHEYDLSGEPDGAYVFSVRGVGENGVRGPVRTDGYALDTHAPAAPEISSPPPPVGSTRVVTLAFGAEPAARVECRLSGGDGGGDWEPCTSPRDFDLSGRPDGNYTLALRATDAAGNTGPQATAEHTLDTTAPAPPAVEAPTVTPATKLQPAFDFAADAADSHECRLDGPGGYATGWQACSSPAPYDLTGQPNGTYTFAVRGTDAAGNTGEPGSASYELIRNPKGVDLRSGPGRIGNARRPRWTFQVAGAASFVCSLEQGSTVIVQPATCGSPRSYNLTGRPDGTYRFTVRATGTDGVAREPVSQVYQLDSTPPARPAVEATPVSPAPDHTPAWSFSGDAGAALDCRITRDQATVVDWTACTNPKPFDLGDGADGDYQVTVRARDTAGNVSPAQTSDYELDSTAPAAPTLTAAPNAEDVDRSPTWTFEGERDAVFSCTLTRGTEVIAAQASCAETKTYNLSGAQPGTYTFTVEATDAAGNTGPARTARYMLAKAPAKTGGSGSAGGGAGATGGGSGDLIAGEAGSGGAGAPGSAATGSSGSPTAGGAGQPTARGGARVPPTSSGARTDGTRGESSPGSAASPAGRARSNAAAGTRARAGTARAGDTPSRATAGDGRRGDDARSRRDLADKVKDAVDSAGRGTTKALTGEVGRTVFPMSLLIILGGFLLVQGRIDRGDPKLAMAPIDGEPDLEFEPPPTRR